MAGGGLACYAIALAPSVYYFGFQVGRARMKHKIMPPAVAGSLEFERVFRGSVPAACVHAHIVYLGYFLKWKNHPVLFS
uniref:Microsomal glutathione S-transferase 2 n=1 Tax=Oryctolagus cuniculus TaxID=9986 RepID=A0A5F9DG80_RABIT